MALEFRNRRFRPPGKKGQYVLAFLGLALAIGIIVSWVAVSTQSQRMKNASKDEEDSSHPTVTEDFSAEDNFSLAVMFTASQEERFATVNVDMEAKTIVVEEQKDVSLGEQYRKFGAAKVTSLLEQPHYIAMNTEQVEKWVNYLEGGLDISLPEEVMFTSPDGAYLHLTAGEHSVTATQTACLLRYNGWSTPQIGESVRKGIVCAVINQYLVAERDFNEDFGNLCNYCATDLRMSDYFAVQDRLTVLAQANQGTIAD